MSKVLQGRLPFVQSGEMVDGGTFNKTVRLLELSLDSFDPDATPLFNRTQRDELKFNRGDIIWNTSINVLQVYDGDNWISLSEALPFTTDPLEATALVGSVQVITNGNIVVSVGSRQNYAPEVKQQQSVSSRYTHQLMQMPMPARSVQERSKTRLA